jgi:hypothetical protein
MDIRITFTAEQAREMASIPKSIEKIEGLIREAARGGLEGVNVNGRIPHDVHMALLKAGYEPMYISERDQTWIWWG